MELATKQQKHAIRSNCDFNVDIKEEWVQWATGDTSKKSLNDLSFTQAELILKQQTGSGISDTQFQKFDIKSSQDKYILSLCHQIGWTTDRNGKKVADMVAFGHWLKTKSPIKLPLTSMGQKQKQKVIFAFEKVVKHFFS